MAKYFYDNDVVSFVVRVEEGHAAECWDYLAGKWVQKDAAHEVYLDIYNHKVISEEDAKKIIEEHTKKLKEKGKIK